MSDMYGENGSLDPYPRYKLWAQEEVYKHLVESAVRYWEKKEEEWNIAEK